MASTSLSFPIICIALSVLFFLCVYHRSIRHGWQKTKQQARRAYHSTKLQFRAAIHGYSLLRPSADQANNGSDAIDLLELPYEADVSSEVNSEWPETRPRLDKQHLEIDVDSEDESEFRERIEAWISTLCTTDQTDGHDGLRPWQELSHPHHDELSISGHAAERWPWLEAVAEWGVQHLHKLADADTMRMDDG